MEQTYRSHIFDHLGLVAGLCDELGIGDVMDHATQQHPELRDLTGGEAVNAMVLNGLGCLNQALSRVPRFFQHKPTSRLIAPRVAPAQLNADALGRALETLSADGGTELSSRMAATAAMRLAFTPTFAHLDRPSVHVDGRDHREEEPEAEVMHSPRGDRRDHRPARNQVMREFGVEHQAGSPVLMQPLSGKSRDAHKFGQVIKEPIAPLQTPDGLTSLVADRALDSADHRQQCAETGRKWITRVPATLQEAPQALAQAAPQRMAPLMEGARDHVWPSSDGGVEHRWVLIASEPRQAHAQHPSDQPLLKHRAQEVHAWKTLCRPTCACEAEARQALAAFAHGLQATSLHERPVCPTRRDGKRGRPSPGTPPDHVVSHLQGMLASC
jgi:transposase